jgi:hypothetical protein
MTGNVCPTGSGSQLFCPAGTTLHNLEMGISKVCFEVNDESYFFFQDHFALQLDCLQSVAVVLQDMAVHPDRRIPLSSCAIQDIFVQRVLLPLRIQIALLETIARRDRVLKRVVMQVEYLAVSNKQFLFCCY